MEGILQYYILASIEKPEKIGNVHKLLEKISVKYIICRPAFVSYYPYYVPMLRYLNEVYGSSTLYNNWFNTSIRCNNIKNTVKVIVEFNNIYVVQIDNTPFINVGEFPVVFSSFNSLLSAVQYLNSNEFAIVLNPLLREFPIIDISNTFVFDKKSSYGLYLISSNASTTLFISPSALNNRPENGWATDLLSWYIHPSIAIAPVYGGNIVLTWASPKVNLKENLSISNLIASWDFISQDQVKEWKKNTPESQFNAIQTISWDKGEQALRVELYNSTWGWKTIRSPLIPVKYGHVYRFVFKVKGENAHAVHAYIREYDANKTLIEDSFLYYPSIGDETFNWKEITIDYIPKNENTRYLQLQIWHGHETDKPLPNIIWVDDVRVYDITNYTKPVTLEIPFKVDKTDNYKLFIRYFKNQEGGAIRVYLDGTPIYIKTKDQLNKFVWEDLGTFKLEKGEHKIVLENVRGFNAVNLFALLPEDEYYKAKGEVERLLQNKTIIYLFEAESDLYREKAEVIKDFNASNGEAVKFKDKGKAWQNVEIVKNSTYKLALKGAGTFNVSIGNYSYILTLNNLTFKYTPMFYLRNGEYKLKIIPLSKNAILDVVWLYSANNNETLEELFQVNETPATVKNYTKINPTLWKVRVNATKPFFLTFAESYDPLWEARVYKDGKLIEKVSPVPVYGVINGFWVNQTGDLEIVLRYTPQDWFERGLIISLTTFVLSIFYIFYDWRREKSDRWAKRLEEKFKKLTSKVKRKLSP
ncbi:putative membrane protein [Thermococcus sp. 2319x1]|nr:putative membrane protein [Thermococcus sp. 2319x1]